MGLCSIEYGTLCRGLVFRLKKPHLTCLAHCMYWPPVHLPRVGFLLEFRVSTVNFVAVSPHLISIKFMRGKNIQGIIKWLLERLTNIHIYLFVNLQYVKILKINTILLASSGHFALKFIIMEIYRLRFGS